MSKPYVICHMASSIDGRIIPEDWGDKLGEYSKLYESCHNSFNGQAWMVGRVTMEKDFTEGKSPDPIKPSQPIERKAFVGDPSADSFAIAVDSKGKLGWDENEIDGDHIIELVSESVSDSYLQYLQNKKISYVFSGKDDLDFSIGLSQLYDVFKIKTVMLEGGGNINGSLLNAGLIDEISLLVLPIADGKQGSATSFEVADYLPEKGAKMLSVIDVKKLEHDVVWLRYKVGK